MTFSPEQIAALEAPLDRAKVKTREQGRSSVSYVEGYHVENEANRIFGFHAWDRETLELRQVAERERKIGKGQYEKDGWGVSYVARVRVTVTTPDGGKVIREGVGAGHGIDADLGQAHESASKEAETDAEKRALKTFGNPFGQALYDKAQANVADVPAPELPALAEGRMAAARGTSALGAWWGRLSAADKLALANVKDDTLKPMAAVADAEAKAEPFPGDMAGEAA
jgi:DNA repair and recombination protein RAD52